MPRTAGVSCSSVTRPILLSFSPISVARCEWWRRIALGVCSALISFAPLAIVVDSEKRDKRAYCLFSHPFGVAGDTAPLQRRHLEVGARRKPTRRILLMQ